ncbi:MAG: glycosyltransferase [Chloroflexota bacterium]|nr:glycosyltransferase [Chloroflexota bacterium]
MRVVHYYPRAFVGDGGMTRAVRKLAEASASAGARVAIVYAEGAETVREARASKLVDWIPVRHAGAGRLSGPLDPGRALRGADVLVLHSAWTIGNVRFGAAARKLGIPYVLAPRGAYDPRIVHRHATAKRVWWRLYERDLVMGARAIHVFFASERAHLEALGYRGPLVVAPNGVEPPAGVRWDGGSGEYVLWFGRFDPEHKGLDLLLRGMRTLAPAERPRLRLLGPDWRGRKQQVRRMVRELGLDKDVVVGDPVHGAMKWQTLARASGFVYPSRWEGFGNSTAEAASIGVPTLVTPYPLGMHLAQHGGAFLAQPTADGLADGLRRLRSADACAVGARGAEVAAQDLAWPSVGERWLRQVAAIV